MTTAPYLDTSALAKWYINEPRSDDFETFITGQQSASISRLASVELRCLLARRVRAGEVTRRTMSRVLSAFEADTRQGFLYLHPLDDGQALAAGEILRRLHRHPLRTLDCLHLAAAEALEADVIATADRVMAEAAESMGFEVVRFD